LLDSVDYLDNFMYSLQLLYNIDESRPVVSVNASSLIFAPARFYGGYSNIDDEKWWAGVTYPFYASLLSGLQGIYASAEY
jgi:hypothetical protein